MSSFGKYLAVAIGAVLLALALYVGYRFGQGSRDAEVSQLTLEAVESEKTVEVQQSLYATTIVQLDGVGKLLDASRAEVAALQKQLSDSQAQLLSEQQLTLKWKQAYEGAVAASQTTVPPTTPTGQTRDRVDFTKDFGPILVTGWTLTNPPEGDVKVQQTRPVVLTVSVAKNPDGTWQSYVTSSDPNIDVQVGLAGVDPGVLSPTWRQRIWVDGGVGVLGGHPVSLGASYHADRFSLGVFCSTWSGGDSCGLSAGFRPFQ